MKGTDPPSEAELARRRTVNINLETVTDTISTDFPYHYPGEDHAWSTPYFRSKCQVQFHKSDSRVSTFSLVGVDASIANAFRRILIAEIPSLAIEYVFVHNNTSIIQDEVLAARLGLVPLCGGSEGLRDFLKWYPKHEEDATGDARWQNATDQNTIVLGLKAECTENKEAEKDEKDTRIKYNNAHIYAKDIVYKPCGRQEQYFSDDNAIRSTNPDILIAKMRPGQVIDLEMHAVKGVGGDHAKFSPVATASYRLLPTIDIVKPILGKDAEKFKMCFPPGVIGLEKVTKKEAAKKGSGYEGHEGVVKAVVHDAMRDMVSRECLRHDEFVGKVKLERIRDHFIFSIESVGQWDSEDLFLESVQVLKRKCIALKANLANMAT